MSGYTEKKLPILLDTDIGSDIDDALCLAYLLKQPACELLGITTVSGEPEKRAMLADAICRWAGRTDIPIRPGAARPLLGESRQPAVPQAAVLGNWRHREDFPNHDAVRFLRETIRSRPHEVTLLAIGPLTNVALLFAVDPEIPGLLKQLVMMCGSLNGLEWNALVDPVACAMVFQADAAAHLTVPLDVTTRCVLPGERARAEIRGGVLDPVAEMSAIWLRERDSIVFHDPLAAALVFAPELCRYAQGRITVELQSTRLAGFTHWDPAGGVGPHRVACSVEAEGFFDHYFQTVRD